MTFDARSTAKTVIDEVEYISRGTLTICIITTIHSWREVGVSACIDLDKYNHEMGREIAYNEALGKLAKNVTYRALTKGVI